MPKTSAEIAAAFQTALDLHETGLDILRSRLRRDDLDAPDDEIDRRVRRWLLNRPLDSPGRLVDLARFGLENHVSPTISRDPAVMGGQPCIAGLHLTVGTIVGLVNAGRSIDQILSAYPYLNAEDIEAAVGYDRQRRGMTLEGGSEEFQA